MRCHTTDRSGEWMRIIILEKSGEITEQGRRIETDGIGCLGAHIRLAEGYTLRGGFRLLERFDRLAQLNPFIPALQEEYQRCPGSACRWPAFDHLVFSKTVEMVGFPGTPRLEIYTTFRGAGSGEPEEIRGLRLENLLDMPIRLGRLKHVVFGDAVDLFEFDTQFTLFEFIDGMAWELSFQGTPRECQIERTP